VTAMANLPESAGLLTRALLETAVLALSVVRSDQRAEQYLRSGNYTIQQTMKAVDHGFRIPGMDVEAGRKVVDQGGIQRTNITQEAENLNIGPWFRGMYAYFSATAHGTGVLVSVGAEDRDEALAAYTGAAYMLLGSVQFTYREWAFAGRITPPKTLVSDMNLPE
jgi:hypothetical protein